MSVGNASVGQHAARWRVVRDVPVEGDAAPRQSTQAARRVVAHDAAIVQALFSDLGQWHERAGRRVKLLDKPNRIETLDALHSELAAIFADCGIASADVHVRCAGTVQRELHRGKVEVVIDAGLFSNHATRMKWVLQQVASVARGEGRAL